MDKTNLINQFSKELNIEVIVTPNKLLDYDGLESEQEKNRLLAGMTVSYFNTGIPKLIIKEEYFNSTSSEELYQSMLYHCRHFEEVHRFTLK